MTAPVTDPVSATASAPERVVRRWAGRLTHLHVHAALPSPSGVVVVTLSGAPPVPQAPRGSRTAGLAHPIGLKADAAADVLALLREGAAAVGIPCTTSGAYWAHGLPG